MPTEPEIETTDLTEAQLKEAARIFRLRRKKDSRARKARGVKKNSKEVFVVCTTYNQTDFKKFPLCIKKRIVGPKQERVLEASIKMLDSPLHPCVNDYNRCIPAVFSSIDKARLFAKTFVDARLSQERAQLAEKKKGVERQEIAIKVLESCLSDHYEKVNALEPTS